MLTQAFPTFTVTSYLMMTDKRAVCATEGLNQKFMVARDETGRKGIRVSSSLTQEDLETKVLINLPVDKYLDMLTADAYCTKEFDKSFTELIRHLEDSYVDDERIESPIGAKCAKCEFHCTPEEEVAGLKSGFKECWKQALGWTNPDFETSSILTLWNSRKKDALIQAGKVKLTDLAEEDLKVKSDVKPGMTASERQWLQVEKVQNDDSTSFVDTTGLGAEMAQWTYPLHCIDFETAMPALPFNKGRRPYEMVLFQFSHHVIHEDGRIEHVGECIDVEQGHFPSYTVLRELKRQLENDDGTIFRYAPHENTVLNQIYWQLKADKADVPDRDELCAFIKTITQSTKNSAEDWKGERNMVDMLELVKRYYYDPAMGGSNSIKYVLPAIMNSSEFLKRKYAEPIYGAEGGTPSINFTDWMWIKQLDGKVEDPYKLLPRLFKDVPAELEAEMISDDDEMRNGAAAMTAYARMQFEIMSDYERDALKQALLKYCELDTFAMVMIYEAWREWVR